MLSLLWHGAGGRGDGKGNFLLTSSKGRKASEATRGAFHGCMGAAAAAAAGTGTCLPFAKPQVRVWLAPGKSVIARSIGKMKAPGIRHPWSPQKCCAQGRIGLSPTGTVSARYVLLSRSLPSSHPFPVLEDPPWGWDAVKTRMRPTVTPYPTVGSMAWIGSNVLGQKGFKLYDESEFGTESDIFIT